MRRLIFAYTGFIAAFLAFGAAIVLTLSLAFPCYGNDAYFVHFKKKAAAGGGGGPAQGDVMNEDFEGTGTPSGWTDSGSNNYDAAVPGTPPVSLGSQSMRVTTTGGDKYGYWSYASATTTTYYYRFYLYIASHDITSGDYNYVFGIGDTSTPFTDPSLFVAAYNTTGQLSLALDGATTSSGYNISTGTWYRVEVRWSDAAGQCTLLVDGNTVGSVSHKTLNYQKWVAFGAFNYGAYAQDVYFDGVGINSSGWLGQ